MKIKENYDYMTLEHVLIGECFEHMQSHKYWLRTDEIDMEEAKIKCVRIDTGQTAWMFKDTEIIKIKTHVTVERG